MENFDKGSLWRKWDLHVHSIKSALNNQFEKSGNEINDEEKYVYELFTRAIKNDVHAIGITDYFSIEGYSMINKYINDDDKLKRIFKSEIELDNDYLNKVHNIAIFPNIELRLEEMVVYKNGNRQDKIEIHVIFDNEVEIESIENDFISLLTIPTEITIDGSNKVSLTRRNLEKLGKKIKDEQPEFSSKNDYEVGCTVAYVKFDDLKKLLDTNFKNKYILLLAEDNITDIKWSNQGHLVRKNIYTQSNGLFSSNPNSIKWGLSDETKEEFSTYKPCFWGSDAHDYNKMFLPDMDRFCWIKADLTFQGLKQVLISPEDRIYIGPIAIPYDNYLKNKQNIISSVSIHKRLDAKNNPTWFDSDIKINPYMTTIIGNKGSGKSALSDIISLVSCSKNIEYASFIEPKRFKLKPENYAGDYTARVDWSDEKSNTIDRLSDNLVESSVELVQFLPQRYIENVCSGIGQEFNTEIEKTIFSYMDLAEKEGCTNLSQLIANKTTANYSLYQNLKNELEKINIDIINLENKKKKIHRETIEEKIKNLNLTLERHNQSKPLAVEKPKDGNDKYAKYISTIDDIKIKIKQEYDKNILELKNINSKITDVDSFNTIKTVVVKEIDELNNKYDELTKKIGLENKKFLSYKICEDDINSKLNILTNRKIELDQLVSQTDVELGKVTLKESFDIEKEDLNNYIKSSKSLFSQMYLLDLIKNKIVNDTSLATQKYQKYLKDLETWDKTRKQIIGEEDGYPDGSLKYYNEQKEYLEKELDSDLDNLILKRKEIIEKIYDYHNSNCGVLKKIYLPIEERLKNVLELMEEKISFTVQVVVDPNLNDKILNQIDQRYNGFFSSKQSGASNLKSLIEETKFNEKESVISFIEDIFSKVTDDYDSIDGILRDKVLEFYNYIGSMDYLKSQYTLRLGGKDLKQLSPGERGIVLLIFYLSLSKSNIPLIIDQPEDNLDNQSVYSKLVPCIKSAKKNRQIIIVTHNPNIAIACDSEQIIYCEIYKKTNAISYLSGSIENNDIRKKVVDILEGTMPAFDLRRQKYN